MFPTEFNHDYLQENRKYTTPEKNIGLEYLLQHGTDSYIMITWYVGQARLFPFQPT